MRSGGCRCCPDQRIAIAHVLGKPKACRTGIFCFPAGLDHLGSRGEAIEKDADGHAVNPGPLVYSRNASSRLRRIFGSVTVASNAAASERNPRLIGRRRKTDQSPLASTMARR